MTESSWISISIVVTFELGVALGAMVVGQFQQGGRKRRDPLPSLLGCGVIRHLGVFWEGSQEVEREFPLGIVSHTGQGKPEDFFIERYGKCWILDSVHSLLIARLASNFSCRKLLAAWKYLNPVVVRVKHKCNIVHTAIRKFLLESHTFLIEIITESDDIIYDEADMAKSARI